VAFLKLGVNIKKDPIAFTAAFLMLAFGVLRILAAVLFL
jgi:hypothetical protein